MSLNGSGGAGIARVGAFAERAGRSSAVRIIAVVAVFGLRLFDVQVIDYSRYRSAALSDQLKQYQIPATRGIIEAHDNGSVLLIKATPDGWKEQGKFHIPEKGSNASQAAYTCPVVANGKLYLRDQMLIFCYDIRKVK